MVAITDDESKEAQLAAFRDEWKQLYSKDLPAQAKAKDSAQPKWPVTLDHCFARILLDNTVGKSTVQWDQVIKKPAVQHMDIHQFKNAIALGRMIQSGAADLVRLDQESLKARQKGEKKYKKQGAVPKLEVENGKIVDYDTFMFSMMQITPLPNVSDNSQASNIKRKRAVGSEEQKPFSQATKKQSSLTFKKPKIEYEVLPAPPAQVENCEKPPGSQVSENDKQLEVILRKINNHPKLTPYRKRLYTILLGVPVGRYTTYTAMSNYLDSAARAVGNGMRNNPFAPEVPCHRVLAGDGSIGGFGGSWGKDGVHANKKINMLQDEGVKFDSTGKVKGPVFDDFKDFEEWARKVS